MIGFDSDYGVVRYGKYCSESLFFVVTSMGFTLFVTALLILLDNLFAYSETVKWVGTICLALLVLLSTTFRLEHDGYIIMSKPCC